MIFSMIKILKIDKLYECNMFNNFWVNRVIKSKAFIKHYLTFIFDRDKI